MIETLGAIFGIIVGAFVLIFGGKGLIELVRERREQKRQASLSTATTAGQIETIVGVKDSGLNDPVTEGTTTTSPPLSDKPSIAVLPFENLSGDPKQEYFSDGITEDLITALSRIRQFLSSRETQPLPIRGPRPMYGWSRRS